MIKAEAQWEINEITIDIQGTPVILFESPVMGRFVHGTVTQAQACLTLSEAKELLVSLHTAIEVYENLEALVELDTSE